MAVERYYDLTRLRLVLGLALLVMVGAELAYGVSSWQYLSLAGEIADGLDAAALDARWNAYQAFEAPMLRVYQIALIACYVLGATWTWCAAWNAARLVPDPARVSATGAVGWYLVPVANLFMPFRAMRQIYNSSTRPSRPLGAAAPALLRWWWALWLLVAALVLLALFLPADPDTDMVTNMALVDVLNTPLSILGIWLWWQVVTVITNLQKATRPAAPTFSEEVVP
ncbi:DUF4328 domain-containing protein [Paracoccus sp. S1E-3]|uniref:DUF4328 domain-containing protein n=1 Tax=Paracoccus sp. S1E-3 TaxID=2756130 RepID=UPI0015EE8439|nr:DUF4328 domain-containing protein [Paracoccus sp. S1E-3]MBA4490823.1 DUF4328 domain-containing protein [Paracoccus sp. S1E-3]